MSPKSFDQLLLVIFLCIIFAATTPTSQPSNEPDFEQSPTTSSELAMIEQKLIEKLQRMSADHFQHAQQKYEESVKRERAQFERLMATLDRIEESLVDISEDLHT
ncbi:hypothetical protein BS007_RS17145 [Vibrio parahaemolyticus]|nr:hypothetical protein [Vibrio parahaemolyticus]HCG9703135.1 hypothetical protein [Vibrio parahaemolyticus]